MDIDIKVERVIAKKEYGGTYGDNRLGLDKYLFDEGNEDDGTHETHGTLFEDRQLITDICYDNFENEKESKNIDNKRKSNIGNILDDKFKKEQQTQEDTTAVNDGYTYSNKVSQASQASQTPKSTTKTDEEFITAINNVSQASQSEHTTPAFLTCHYCNYSHNNEKDVERHSIISHPGKIARPDDSILKLLKSNNNREPSINDNHDNNKELNNYAFNFHTTRGENEQNEKD